ncbi:hypothetical protein CEXT_746141 [Caerostris extrusa]|uniref:Uncharacterized protein n=1 Tax=Caerostris extrusa TaxID=172846 RepID=A0AAV4VW09_CAEEX|nr:hypothetical protein CEXT_746141 [Caerostris extrusa]
MEPFHKDKLERDHVYMVNSLPVRCMRTEFLNLTFLRLPETNVELLMRRKLFCLAVNAPSDSETMRKEAGVHLEESLLFGLWCVVKAYGMAELFVFVS